MNLSPEEQEYQNRLLRAFENVRTISMALNYVEHLLDPNKPYTPAMNTPTVKALLNEVKPGSSAEQGRAAVRTLQERLTAANNEYQKITEEGKKFS
ncbi:hypothetical protein ONA70_15505 [Micromonospora yasonensis]|uniref:hypothetical protein n=1 Tax=Micromonospora yasonensis TaxID=1128667 RepID=UPI002231D06B|nr:hypothetical protein [Micromonospora yasonensis]MCW3841507.1 hypothetical protein [Micromonospora yasonensis]